MVDDHLPNAGVFFSYEVLDSSLCITMFVASGVSTCRCLCLPHNRRHQEPDFHRNDAIAEEAGCCGTWQCPLTTGDLRGKWTWNAVVRIVRYCSPAEDMTEPEMMWNAVHSVHLIFIYCIIS